MTNHMRSCSFLHAHFFWINESGREFVYGEKLIYWKDICCRYTLEFQCVPTTYVTENKEGNYLEIYIFQVSCSLSLPLLNIPNCIKIRVTLLQIVYICMTAIIPNSSSWTTSLLTYYLCGCIISPRSPVCNLWSPPSGSTDILFYPVRLSIRLSVLRSVTKCVISCERNYSYNFSWIFLRLYNCFYQGLEMCMRFGCNPQIILSLFSQCELSHFWLDFYQSK